MLEQASLATEIDSETFTHRPLVSVIVTVYNQAPYVRECLDSIVGTGYPNMELIVVDDASQDGSDEVIRRWIGEHPGQGMVYLNHQQNAGLANSLNEAIGVARGEILCLIAGDDLLLPNGIADRVDYLSRNPDKLLVFADCHVIDAEGKQIHESAIEGLYRRAGMRKRQLAVDKLVPYSIFHNWAICGPMTMCRPEAYRAAGLYDNQLIVDDWDLYLRIAALGKVGFHNGYVGKYRLHRQNTITTQRERVVRDCLRICRKYAHLFPVTSSLRSTFLQTYCRYNDSRSAPRKAFYFLLTGALYMLSGCVYRAVGWVLLLKYKRFRGGAGKAPTAGASPPGEDRRT